MLLCRRAQRYLTFISGFPAVEASTSAFLSLHRETKFIIGFDFAVTLSSPECFCVLFDITSEQLVQLKWLMLNKFNKWFHSSRVKFPLVSMSASRSLVSMYLIWIFGVQINSIEQPIKSNSVGSGNMSHCRASSLQNHLDYCFVVFEHIQQSFLARRIDVWGKKINIVQIIDHSLRLFSFLNCVKCRTNFTFVL